MFKKFFGNKKIMSRSDFQAEMLNRISNCNTVKSAHLFGEFSIKKYFLNEGDYEISNLENAYRDYSASDISYEDRNAVFERWVNNFSKPLKSGAVSGENLYPIVRHIEYLGENRMFVEEAFSKGKRLGDRYDGPCVQSFVADMVFMLAVEGEDVVDCVSKNDLLLLGLGENEAWNKAFENALASRFDPVFEQINEAGLAVASCPDEQWMTPTLLVHNELWQNLMINNELDALLIAVPCRSGVFFADASLDYAEDMMRSVIATMLEEHHPQSSYLLRIRRGSSEIEIVE